MIYLVVFPWEQPWEEPNVNWIDLLFMFWKHRLQRPTRFVGLPTKWKLSTKTDEIMVNSGTATAVPAVPRAPPLHHIHRFHFLFGADHYHPMLHNHILQLCHLKGFAFALCYMENKKLLQANCLCVIFTGGESNMTNMTNRSIIRNSSGEIRRSPG